MCHSVSFTGAQLHHFCNQSATFFLCLCREFLCQLFMLVLHALVVLGVIGRIPCSSLLLLCGMLHWSV